ncbi:ETC complex I subunit conserved region-domain-containing protein [Staphylotrichum tortipilum]|uniref:ETC complex I subunit conserved region-domain-containing protein n=1 Tax=Staphylotrichum tortipilum TaxID=2831512 RepID=A0AAN6RQC7_9PEZI|nr:ETC complex I subunit conserved region-domain-containing protein [Staphylotrichum longicolle]
MRATARLLAAVRSGAARYLEAGTPTGLTGLLTHASPRSTLLYLYSTTLDRLSAGVPEHSVYRQSVEAVTRHRLALVEAAVPAGHAEWTARAHKLLAAHPDEFNISTQASVSGARAIKVERDGRAFVVHTDPVEVDMRDQEWDGELDEGGELEGSRTAAEREDLVHIIERRDLSEVEQVEWEPEPQLTADQISELENKIGAGLIEEVIQVAEGELKLVDTMVQAKVWEPLEEKPAEGQWVYFERKA